NVVLFGTPGCGKSSIINLLADEPIAQVSMDVDPCTKRPRWYEISISERRFRLWDTMGIHLDHGGDTENAVGLIREVSQQGGVDLLLLCRKASWSPPSELDQYRLFKEFLCEGQVPVAVVVTHLEWYDPMEKWW
ncbi:P-loop containing nucleoside triphosphate hydrolase protein, partial [Imleria badia]